MALETNNDRLQRRAKDTVLRDLVAKCTERLLQGGDSRILHIAAQGLDRFNRHRIEPQADTVARQTRPIEGFAGVGFAARRDIAMPLHASSGNVMAGDNILR